MKKPSRLVIDFPVEQDLHPAELVETGEKQSGVGRWVPDQKHRYLSKYIDAARSAARSPKFSQWVYIDPFCGPGRVRVQGETHTRPGGALAAWQQSKRSGTPFGTMLIGDIDGDRVAACTARLRSEGANVVPFVGKATDTTVQMIKAIPARALCLAYLDPYNLALLSYPMIAALAKYPKIDFVVHFSTMDLYRNIDAALDPERARLDDVSPGWRTRAPQLSKATLGDWVFRDWCEQVRGLNFTFSQSMPLVTNNGDREIYRLAFFARHELPVKLWTDTAKDPTPDMFD